MKLRSYQAELSEKALLSSGNILIQADTGAGKTPVLAAIASKSRHVLLVAHTNLLIKQASKIFARFGIQHGAIATKHTKRICVIEHRKLGLGDGMMLDNADKWVCSIDSLLSRYKRGLLPVSTNTPFIIIVDEAHHMTDANKWGKLCEIFPNARIIGATATPCRLDQVSLARSKGGVFDELIQASELKQDSFKRLVERGLLSDFKCYSVPERLNTGALKLGSHDYTYKSLEIETSRVVFEMAGDAVKHYQQLADGKQALAVCVSIDIAIKTADKFKQANIAAAAIHSRMSAVEVSRIFDLFERRHIKVLCNVDMIGEGVDVPAIECLIMMRKTASFGLYRQWMGRAARVEKGKDFAIYIDHVGNIRTHGMPDKHIDWSLENPPQAEKSNLFPCPECNFLLKAWVDKCPECGADLSRAVDAKLDKDVNYIDYQLVELKRKEVDKKKKIEAQELLLRTELQLKKPIDGRLIEKNIYKIKQWFCDVMLKQGVELYTLNKLLLANQSTDFWISQFVLADLNKNEKKCTTVYEQWIKKQKRLS